MSQHSTNNVPYQSHKDIIRKNNNCCHNDTIKNLDCCKKPEDAVNMTKRKTLLAKEYYTRLEDRRKNKDCGTECNIQKSYHTSKIDRIKYQNYRRVSPYN